MHSTKEALINATLSSTFWHYPFLNQANLKDAATVLSANFLKLGKPKVLYRASRSELIAGNSSSGSLYNGRDNREREKRQLFKAKTPED